MRLTGKCREDFNLWYFEMNKSIEEYKIYPMLSETCRNALIIDFLDFLGIYIEIKNKFGQIKQKQRFSFVVKGRNSGFIFDYRLQAINEAIKKANEIYNHLNKD